MSAPPDPPGRAPRDDLPFRRLHPAYLLISGGRALRSLLPVIAVGIWRIPGWTIGVVAGLVAVFAVAGWLTKRYAILHGVFHLQSGVLNRTVHTVPITRITAVDASRGIVQRLLRVWGVTLRTPAGGDTRSLHLACVTAAELARLRTALAPHHRAASAAPVAAGPEPGPAGPATVIARQLGAGATDDVGSASVAITAPEPLAVLDSRTLAVATVTGVSIPLIFAGLSAAWERARALLPRDTLRRLEQQLFGPDGATVLILVAIAVAAVVIGSLLTAQRMARFTLVRDGDVLRTSRGLFSQQTATITVARVHAVRLVEGWLRRRLGWCAVEVEISGAGTAPSGERTLFPLLRREQAAALVERALPELHWVPAPLTPVPRASRRRFLTVPVWIGVGVAALGWLVFGRPTDWWAVLVALPPVLGVLIGVAQARAAGWALDRETVVFRGHRVLARVTTVARLHRVQLTQRRQTWWQRRAGIASLRITLASRRTTGIRHLPLDEIRGLRLRVGRPAPR
ncbi:PH domain-containing protein [Nakamurella leprariae]|uniref:PH domain-containing protein n=1 Tax=Nakamurella leprariae TaxID=2803911 RepID=A0A938Y964_9ACTN|nr:PH domain-containing protein [Nakamurella leprariae]MBM9468150.1 PH domain-containing protein [Nakamurella leprariae]